MGYPGFLNRVPTLSIMEKIARKGNLLLPGPLKTALAALLLLLAAPPGSRAVDHGEPLRHLPEEREILYLPGKFAACIPCHPRPVFEDEDFNVDTYFRDTQRGKNLHWMHVFRQPQGTNCSACHRPGEGASGVAYPPEIHYEMRPDGGSCTPPCHRPKQYRNAGRPPRR